MKAYDCCSCGHSWSSKKAEKPYRCPLCASTEWFGPTIETPEAAPEEVTQVPLSVPTPVQLPYPTYEESIRYLYLGQPLPKRLQTPKHKAEILAKEKLGPDCHKPLWSLA